MKMVTLCFNLCFVQSFTVKSLVACSNILSVLEIDFQTNVFKILYPSFFFECE
jgi:hypothetical protein